MKRLWGVVAAGWIGISIGVSPCRADSPIEATILTDTTHDTGKVSDTQYGDGEEKIETPSFSVKLRTGGMDAIPSVSLKLYVMATRSFDKDTQKLGKDAVVKVLEKKDIALPSGEDVVAELGQVEFRSRVTHSGVMTWIGGTVYDGYALEIYNGDQLLDVKYGGGGGVRQAYAAYLKKNS